jgi:hypothetical protein
MRQALLAVLAKYADEFLERRTVDDIRGTDALTRRHAHIKGAVLHEAKSPRCVIDLRRRDAEIEKNAVELEPGLNLVGASGQRRKWREKNRDTLIRREPSPGFYDSLRISI